MANLDKILEHAVKNKLNVLLKGNHGVGKTAMVKEAFTNAGLKWKYFSAATMDPWVDFIGVPKEKSDDKGNCFLELIRPKEFADDQVEAIFFDELNRAPKKVRNAVMELIQFKSINGKKFEKLSVIWAAINPDDEDGTYDVEKLDPAQIDRFQIHIDVPNEPSMPYFKAVYGNKGERAVKWWKGLDDKLKVLVSPRRLEYALQVIDLEGSVRNVLDAKVNVASFIATMKNGDPTEILNELLKKPPEEASRFLMDNNNYKHVRETLLSDDRFVRSLTSLLPTEILLKEITPRAGNKDYATKLTAHIAQNAEMFDALTGPVMENPRIYPEIVNAAFKAHKRRQEMNEKNAIAGSASMLKKLEEMKSGNMPTNPKDRIVILNGNKIRIEDLTIDNFKELTGGRNFRVTADQQSRIEKGLISREGALKEFLDKIAKDVPENKL